MYQTVAEMKKRSCIGVLLMIILACTIIGLIIVIPMLRGQKSVTKTYAVCQTCGNRWVVK